MTTKGDDVKMTRTKIIIKRIAAPLSTHATAVDKMPFDEFSRPQALTVRKGDIARQRWVAQKASHCRIIHIVNRIESYQRTDILSPIIECHSRAILLSLGNKYS